MDPVARIAESPHNPEDVGGLTRRGTDFEVQGEIDDRERRHSCHFMAEFARGSQ